MTGSSPIRVGVVGGTRLPGNVRTFLTNLRRLLEDHPTDFDLDLVGNSKALPRLPGYRIVDPGVEPSGRAIGTIRTLTSALTRYARANPVDVLFQVTKFPVHGFAATVAGRRTSTPVLTRYAGDNFREYQLSESIGAVLRTYALNNGLGQVPARFSDGVIVLGPHGRKMITSRRNESDVYTIPQPIDTKRFPTTTPNLRKSVRSNLQLDDDSRVLLTIGRLTVRKGIDDLIWAAEHIADRNVVWLVIGSGPFEREVASIPNIRHENRIPHSRISNYYHAADLLVHPSRIEGLPNVLLEAAACGIPSVARDVGDAPLIASQTYQERTELSEIVFEQHEPVNLGNTFEPDRLATAYAGALTETAGKKD